MISIIAPVYNVEPYIKQFLESVVNQTYKDFELVIVDDCSSDKSIDICSDYAERDERIKIFLQNQNRGVAHARNIGMQESKGEYVMFADSDDYLAQDALQTAINLLRKNNADIAYCGFYQNEGGAEKRWKSFKEYYSHKDAIVHSLNFKTLYGYSWGKLFRKEILFNVSVPEDMSVGEDGVFSFRALKNANEGVCFTRKPIYYYRIRKDSLSGHGQNFSKRDLDVFKQIKYVTDCVDEQFSNEITIFTFGLYTGTIRKYLNSSLDIKKEYENEYKIMSDYCEKNWMKVLVHSINPRMKLQAIKTRMLLI